MVTQFRTDCSLFQHKMYSLLSLECLFFFNSNFELNGTIICKVVTLSDSDCYSIRDKLDNIETLKKNNYTFSLP